MPVTPAECSIHLNLHRPHSIFILVPFSKQNDKKEKEKEEEKRKEKRVKVKKYIQITFCQVPITAAECSIDLGPYAWKRVFVPCR